MLRSGARSCRFAEGASQGSGRESEIHARLRPVTEPGLLDTGPLVSFLADGLRHHAWAVEQWKQLRPPLLTDAIFALLERGVIRVALAVEKEQADLRALMQRYRNQPMSLADACLVRLSEIHAPGEVLTSGSDFRIYRRYGNRVIGVLMPD